MAVPIVKQPKAIVAGSILHLGLQIFAERAQHDGPKANPRLYNETEAVKNSAPTMSAVAGEILDEARLPAHASIAN